MQNLLQTTQTETGVSWSRSEQLTTCAKLSLSLTTSSLQKVALLPKKYVRSNFTTFFVSIS